MHGPAGLQFQSVSIVMLNVPSPTRCIVPLPKCRNCANDLDYGGLRFQHLADKNKPFELSSKISHGQWEKWGIEISQPHQALPLQLYPRFVWCICCVKAQDPCKDHTNGGSTQYCFLTLWIFALGGIYSWCSAFPFIPHGTAESNNDDRLAPKTLACQESVTGCCNCKSVPTKWSTGLFPASLHISGLLTIARAPFFQGLTSEQQVKHSQVSSKWALWHKRAPFARRSALQGPTWTYLRVMEMCLWALRHM